MPPLPTLRHVPSCDTVALAGGAPPADPALDRDERSQTPKELLLQAMGVGKWLLQPRGFCEEEPASLEAFAARTAGLPADLGK